MAQGLRAGGPERAAAVDALRGSVQRLAFDPDGSRVVQLALESVGHADAGQLASELRGRVREAAVSPHANHVIQKVIAVMPAVLVSFVEEELRGLGPALARHGYGCRVLCRLLEHSDLEARPVPLLEAVLRDAGGLCRHSFGQHVLEAILEHGPPGQQRRIAEALREGMLRGTLNRHAHSVLAKALTYCPEGDRCALAEQLLKDPEALAALGSRSCGADAVRALLRDAGAGLRLPPGHLERARARLAATKPGRQLLRELDTEPSA